MDNLIGLKVYVYFNLNKHVWSIKALEGERKNRVVGYADSIELIYCNLKVSEKGRQRVLKQKQKNVHAGVVGYIKSINQHNNYSAPQRISYNPYKTGHFYLVGSDQPCAESYSRLIFTGHKPESLSPVFIA